MKKTFYLLLVTFAFVACINTNQNAENESNGQQEKPDSINIDNSRAHKFFASRENRGNNIAVIDTIPASEEIVLADTTTVEPEPVAQAQPAPAATTTTTTRRTTNSSNSNSSSSSSDSSNRRNSNNSSNSSSNSDVSYSGGDSAGDSAGGGR